MRFAVTWTPSAEQDLADLWLNASDRDAVRAAADEIDARLQRNPLHEGQARANPTRILHVPPLAVLFDVSVPDRLVNVWAV
jgi:plasmid stabilization system protein ParE